MYHPTSYMKLFCFFQEDLEWSLRAIHDVATRSWGTLCVTERFRTLSVPLSTGRFEGARQKADLAATLLKDLGIAHHNGELIFNGAGKRKRNNNGEGARGPVNNEGAFEKEMTSDEWCFIFIWYYKSVMGLIFRYSTALSNNLFSDTRVRYYLK